MPQTTIRLHPIQYRFRHSDAPYRAFVGGRGAGKSFVGAYDLLRRAKPNRLYGAYAPTYPMLRDAALRSFMEIGESLRFIRSLNKSDMTAVLGNGAEVLFRSLDDPERARGPNLSGAWIDEASLVVRDAYNIVIACLREQGEAGWFSATFTPRGRQHWTFDVFGAGRPDSELFHARSTDNPFLPPEFVSAIRQQYTDQYAAQELGGEFVDLVGNLAQRSWFPIVGERPEGGRRVRAWDLAATVKKVAGDDPDYTVGTLMCRHEDGFYVEDVCRVRLAPGALEDFIKATAERDGRGILIRLEQEPGASGKIASSSLVRMLAGYVVRAEPSSGDKVSRAMPMLAQAEHGNIKLVRASWNAAWLDEVVAFPVSVHDDQVDSAAMAFNAMALHTGTRQPNIRVTDIGPRV